MVSKIKLVYLNYAVTCPKCNRQLDLQEPGADGAVLAGGEFMCHACGTIFEYAFQLPDPRSPTLRAAVQSEQNGADEIKSLKQQVDGLISSLDAIAFGTRNATAEELRRQARDMLTLWGNSHRSNRSAGG